MIPLGSHKGVTGHYYGVTFGMRMGGVRKDAVHNWAKGLRSALTRISCPSSTIFQQFGIYIRNQPGKANFGQNKFLSLGGTINHIDLQLTIRICEFNPSFT